MSAATKEVLKANMENFSIMWEDDNHLSGIVEDTNGNGLFYIDREEGENFKMEAVDYDTTILQITEDEVYEIEEMIYTETDLEIDGHGIDVEVHSSSVEVV